MGEWEKAGEVWSMDGSSEWFCNIPESEWLGNPEKIKKDFVEGIGDKRQEVVCLKELALANSLGIHWYRNEQR